MSGDSADGSDSAGVPGPGVKVEMVLISVSGSSFSATDVGPSAHGRLGSQTILLSYGYT